MAGSTRSPTPTGPRAVGGAHRHGHTHWHRPGERRPLYALQAREHRDRVPDEEIVLGFSAGTDLDAVRVRKPSHPWQRQCRRDVDRYLRDMDTTEGNFGYQEASEGSCSG